MLRSSHTCVHSVSQLVVRAASVCAVPRAAFSSSAASASVRPAATVRAPSRLAMLSTYRQLRRAIFQTFYVSSQYATYDELARDEQAINGRSPSAAYRKEAFAAPENAAHVAFAEKRSQRWLAQLRDSFATAAAASNSAEALARAHRDAEQHLTLLISNMEHSRFLLEGGWGIRRNQVKQLSNVAHKVGLQMPKETAPLDHVPAGAKHQKARDAVLHKHDKFVK